MAFGDLPPVHRIVEAGSYSQGTADSRLGSMSECARRTSGWIRLIREVRRCDDTALRGASATSDGISDSFLFALSRLKLRRLAFFLNTCFCVLL